MNFQNVLLERAHSKGTYAEVVPSQANRLALFDWVNKCEDITDPLSYEKYHTTIIYSRTPVPEAEKYQWTLPAYGDIIGWTIFAGPVYRCLVALIDSYQLRQFNADLNALGATSDFPSYIPHITVSYNYGKEDVPSEFPKMRLTYDHFKVMPLDPKFKP